VSNGSCHGTTLINTRSQ